jgi:hypothetical protein
MHFGGVHLFIALGFVAISFLLTYAYLVLLYLFLIGLRRGYYWFRYSVLQDIYRLGNGPHPDKVLKKPVLPFKNVSFFKKSALLLAALTLFLYGYQRINWMGPESQHHQAKEYWIAGQVTHAPRVLFERLTLHPDNVLLRPYIWLQQNIYNRGVEYLPSDDGEQAVWYNHWFIYPYARRSKRPYGVLTKEPSPEMVVMLDHCWETMERISTLPIADPQMEHKALLDWPVMFSYYLLYQGYYTGPIWLAANRRLTDPRLRDREYQVLAWLDSLSQRWIEERMTLEIWQDKPVVACFRQKNLLRLLQSLCLSLVYFGEFSCDHPLVERLYSEYHDAMSDDPIRSSFLSWKRINTRQAELAYQISIYGAQGASANYLLNNICGKEMPEELYLATRDRGMLSSFRTSKTVEHVYEEVLKPLIEGGEYELLH